MPTSVQFDHQHVPFVASLAHFGRTSLALAGGKGANLGELLLRAGFDVPPGFVVTTAAYDLVLLGDDLRNLLTSLEPGDPTQVAQVAGLIRQALERVPVPPSVAQEVLNAYRQLGGLLLVNRLLTNRWMGLVAPAFDGCVQLIQ